ncbi:hypothetical protein ACFYXV_13030 [Streptomyces sp. NPDC002181]|uniref:hypothetical protein n=1 Tax=Streptomyces sp. NPDC002181 TaxID=3364635 RepID=UPI0036869732
MAIAGQVGSAYWPGCSPAREKYVARFRSLISAMSMRKQGARAKYLGIPLSTLSNYWTGRRVPSALTLGAIYDAVRRSAAAVPDQLEHLERLRKSAARRNTRPVSPWERSDICAAELISSAPSAPLASGACGQSGADPAQRPAADRRSSENGKAGETVRALYAAQSAGDRRGVIGIAWSASKTLTHEELSLAAADLYASGNAVLGEALLLGGRERGHEETMRLAITLIRADLTIQAELVLRAALPRGGGGQL